MSEQPVVSWSDNPNAPRIPPDLHHLEKAHFAGDLICAVLYGTSTYMSVYPCLPSALCLPLQGWPLPSSSDV